MRGPPLVCATAVVVTPQALAGIIDDAHHVGEGKAVAAENQAEDRIGEHLVEGGFLAGRPSPMAASPARRALLRRPPDGR